MKKSTRKATSPKLQLVNKNWAALQSQPLLMANPQAALPLLSMIGQAQLSIEDLLGRMSRQFVEQLLMMAAESVAGPKHPGRAAGEVRWHGCQGGLVNLGTSRLKITRPRLRGPVGEVALPGYAELAGDGNLSRRIADVLACNVSTRKYARVMYRCADEMGISRSAVSRHFVRDSAQALAKLTSRDLSKTDLVAIYVDGIIVARHHIIAAIGVDPSGAKHMLGLAPGSSENARVVKDLLGSLAQRGVDLNIARLWVIDGSKALRSAIDQLCGEAAQVQRCRIHKIRNVTERLPKDIAAQTRWVMTQALKGEADAGIQKLKAHAQHLKAQHPDAAASLLEGLEELFTINRLGVTGELARCLATTNIIESPNSAVRRVSGRVTRYRDAQMAMRWVAAGFLEAEKAFRRLRGHDRIPALIRALRPVPVQSKIAA
ncbi:MAG: transposase [Acetobacteraceae bacterium]|nr:transposase [Acetobacteraceae bacterium]